MTEGRYKSQQDMILDGLLEGQKIDPMKALNDYGCFRLGGRIFDLRQDGYPIEDEWFTTSRGARVKRYFIPAQPSLIQK